MQYVYMSFAFYCSKIDCYRKKIVLPEYFGAGSGGFLTTCKELRRVTRFSVARVMPVTSSVLMSSRTLSLDDSFPPAPINHSTISECDQYDPGHLRGVRGSRSRKAPQRWYVNDITPAQVLCRVYWVHSKACLHATALANAMRFSRVGMPKFIYSLWLLQIIVWL